MFHRLTVPTYFGGLPSGFDYINTPSLSGGSGTPAFMDGKKSGGPNDGTYAVAFGEDATSNFANRGIKALAENTDLIDNILRKDLALTARTADVLSSGLSSMVITGDVFVGTLGTPNTQEQRDLLISVLDSSDNEIVDPSSGQKVVALSIVDNNVSSTNLVGTQASGFYNTVTVNFNVPIASGTTFRIYYGERGNLANLPQDAFTTIKIRGAQEVSADVERALLTLHSDHETQWNAPWVATIQTLAANGFDGMYRLNTNDYGFPNPPNTPGSGGTIWRDGPALTVQPPSLDFSAVGYSGPYYPDPLLASFMIARYTYLGGTYDPRYGGDNGIVQESPWHSTTDTAEGAYNHVPGSLVLDVVPREFFANTLGGTAVVSRITPNAIATVNPDAGTSSDARSTVQVAATDIIRDSSGNATFRMGDLLQVTAYPSEKVIGTFRVSMYSSNNRLLLRTLSGAPATIGLSGTASSVHLRWLQPTMQLGGRYRTAADPSQGYPYFTVAQPSPAVNNWGLNHYDVNAVFLSAMTDRTLSGGPSYNAMAWGGYATSGFWYMSGFLDGDGGISVTGGKQTFNIIGRRYGNFIVYEGGRAVNIDPYVNGSQIHIYTSGALHTVSPIQVAIDTSSGYVPTSGDEIDIYLVITANTSSGTISMTWPSNFIFSGGDDSTVPDGYPVFGPSAPAIAVHFKCRYVSTPSLAGWFIMRSDY